MTPPKPLPCRLSDLVREFQGSAAMEKAKGNDEAYCCISAAADRLTEVVTEWFVEMKAFNAQQRRN
jgi:hypothetical protein